MQQRLVGRPNILTLRQVASGEVKGDGGLDDSSANYDYRIPVRGVDWQLHPITRRTGNLLNRKFHFYRRSIFN